MIHMFTPLSYVSSNPLFYLKTRAQEFLALLLFVIAHEMCFEPFAMHVACPASEFGPGSRVQSLSLLKGSPRKKFD